jgi:predicted secreted protein
LKYDGHLPLAGVQFVEKTMSFSLTEADNGRELEVKVNDTFDLRLRESRMGGYRWSPLETGQPFLAMTEIRMETHAATPLPGESNVRAWHFLAQQPGLAHLRLQHRRSWEPESAGSQFALTVKVAA